MHFLVNVKVLAPYPIESKHTIKATSAATASARAIREALGLKREGKPVINKRRIDSYTITIKRI